MATKSGRATDPLVGFQFSLELQGAVTGFFSDVSGLESETEVIEHKVVDGKGQGSIQKIPGRLKWANVTLKRGVTADTQIWEWRKLVEEGKIKDARKNGSIVMYDYNFEKVAQWDLVNAWPSKVSGPQFKSDSNEVGVEELTIVHEGFKRVQ